MTHYKLHRYYIKWLPATKNHGPLAEVHIHGTHKGFFVKDRVVQYFKIPIEPHTKRDQTTSKQLVRQAMRMSDDRWTTPFFW